MWPDLAEIATTSPHPPDLQDGDGHFFAYRRKELLALFREAGFADLRARFFETPAVSGHMKFRLVQQSVPKFFRDAVETSLSKVPFVNSLLCYQLLVVGRRQG